MFKRYPWPGNFRQLHNLLRTAVVIAGDDEAIQLHHLPDDFLEDAIEAQPPEVEKMSSVIAERPADKDDGNLQDITLAAMAQTLRLHNGNVSTTAKALGVSRNTIYRKMSLLPPSSSA